jgi:hypothetical protein
VLVHKYEANKSDNKHLEASQHILQAKEDSYQKGDGTISTLFLGHLSLHPWQREAQTKDGSVCEFTVIHVGTDLQVLAPWDPWKNSFKDIYQPGLRETIFQWRRWWWWIRSGRYSTRQHADPYQWQTPSRSKWSGVLRFVMDSTRWSLRDEVRMHAKLSMQIRIAKTSFRGRKVLHRHK